MVLDIVVFRDDKRIVEQGYRHLIGRRYGIRGSIAAQEVPGLEIFPGCVLVTKFNMATREYLDTAGIARIAHARGNGIQGCVRIDNLVGRAYFHLGFRGPVQEHLEGEFLGLVRRVERVGVAILQVIDGGIRNEHITIRRGVPRPLEFDILGIGEAAAPLLVGFLRRDVGAAGTDPVAGRGYDKVPCTLGPGNDLAATDSVNRLMLVSIAEPGLGNIFAHDRGRTIEPDRMVHRRAHSSILAHRSNRKVNLVVVEPGLGGHHKYRSLHARRQYHRIHAGAVVHDFASGDIVAGRVHLPAVGDFGHAHIHRNRFVLATVGIHLYGYRATAKDSRFRPDKAHSRSLSRLGIDHQPEGYSTVGRLLRCIFALVHRMFQRNAVSNNVFRLDIRSTFRSSTPVGFLRTVQVNHLEVLPQLARGQVTHVDNARQDDNARLDRGIFTGRQVVVQNFLVPALRFERYG